MRKSTSKNRKSIRKKRKVISRGHKIVYKMNGDKQSDKKDSIKVIEQIFKGPFSQVYKVSIDDDIYVKKVIKNYSLFLRELKILKRVSNIHSPRIYSFYEEEDSNIIIQEYIDGLDLKDYIKKNYLNKDQTLFIIKQILEGFINIHNNGVYHRDIKPTNIIITKGGLVKIIDYGFSCIKGENCDKLLKGTPYYVAPELFHIQSGSIEEKDWESSELYSIGCVLYFIIHGYSPYEGIKHIKNIDQLKQIVKSDKDTPYDPSEHEDIDFIIKKLLEKNPHERLTLEQALELINKI